jgi:hypothetical protein
MLILKGCIAIIKMSENYHKKDWIYSIERENKMELTA